jgi:subtilisin family serine protease
MRSTRVGTAGLAVVVALASALVAGTPSTAAPDRNRAPGQAFVPGQLLVRFRSGMSPDQVSRVNGALGATTLESFHSVSNLLLVGLPDGLSVTEAIARFERRTEVMYAEPNFIWRIDRSEVIPNDADFDLQWNWHNTGQSGGTADADVDAVEAWDQVTGDATVIVGFLDTGVQYTHPDLSDNMWQNTLECDGTPGADDDANGYVDDCFGIDTINHDSDPTDDVNHGSHVAGIMGAVTNNSTGVAGMSWDVQLLPCKSHDVTGNGTNDSLLECLQYFQDVKARGEKVVATNNSYGGCLEACDYSQSLYDAIQAQMDAGILFLASAGNDQANNDDTPKYPTNYFLPNVMGVAATDDTDSLAFFSNYGAHTVSLGAPGNSIYSTLRSGAYGYLSGTSMAAPHVTGLAGLLAASDDTLDWKAIRNLILAGGDRVSALANTISGRRMNANGSLNCAGTRVFAPLRPLPETESGLQPIAALNIRCQRPTRALTVTINPGGQSLRLRDTGIGSDIAAEDGIFSGRWKPCTPGTYTLTYSNGMVDTVVVTGPGC